MDKLTTAASRPLFPALAWVATLLLSIPLTGFAKFDLPWLVYVGLTLAIAGVELLLLHLIYRDGRKGLWLAWKKFTGYSLPVFYFAHALPRVSWEKAGLIGEGRAAFIFAVTALATILGCLVFFLASRPATLAAFDVIPSDAVKDRARRKEGLKQRAATSRRRNVLLAVLDWVDALAWAAIAVLIVNIFIFQLYVVPSESMVPAFLVNDRPFTLKLASGPRIPLTQWRLPFIAPPQRGDIITIANPRYAENQGVDLKKYVSQLLFMLTFTNVNIDQNLPDGTPKADPLVKRVVGVPGDRLMMVDDQLYARREGDADWRPVREPWAQVDLWKLPATLLPKIQAQRIDEKFRAELLRLDTERLAVDPAALATTMAARLPAIEASLSRIGPSALAAFGTRELSRAPSSIAARRDEAIQAAASGKNPWSQAAITGDDLALSLAAAGDARVREALRAYAKGAVASAAAKAADPYETASRSFSLLVKDNLLARVEIDLSLLASGARIEAFGGDVRLGRLLAAAGALYRYLEFWDMRAFPAFPRDSYLGPTQYFAMGDNRYNSLDFRYLKPETRDRALDSLDPVPVIYPSNLEPFALERSFIEGKALFRLWPFDRFGAIK